MKKSTIVLIAMLAAAAAAIGFGLYVISQRINSPLPQEQSDSNQTPSADEQTDTEQNTSVASTVGWKTYSNDKHAFTVQHPPYLKAGAVSDNSVLGTFQVPVRGFHVGPLVLVALKDKSLAKDAMDYFNGVYNAALNPQPQPGAEAGAVVCTVDKIANPNVVSIKSVSCEGEGGPAKYAYITGKSYDVFVDGYSKGYDNSGSGDFTNTSDYPTILSTFIFVKDIATPLNNSPTPTPTPTSDSDPSPTSKLIQSIQAVSISADDTNATPNMIMVPAGTIVEITFKVASSNVYYEGLDFRSSVVNSGTINAGASKTISFTAKNSFDFTPYWPASGVAKNYKISVVVQ